VHSEREQETKGERDHRERATAQIVEPAFIVMPLRNQSIGSLVFPPFPPPAIIPDLTNHLQPHPTTPTPRASSCLTCLPVVCLLPIAPLLASLVSAVTLRSSRYGGRSS